MLFTSEKSQEDKLRSFTPLKSKSPDNFISRERMLIVSAFGLNFILSTPLKSACSKSKHFTPLKSKSPDNFKPGPSIIVSAFGLSFTLVIPEQFASPKNKCFTPLKSKSPDRLPLRLMRMVSKFGALIKVILPLVISINRSSFTSIVLVCLSAPTVMRIFLSRKKSFSALQKSRCSPVIDCTVFLPLETVNTKP